MSNEIIVDDHSKTLHCADFSAVDSEIVVWGLKTVVSPSHKSDILSSLCIMIQVLCSTCCSQKAYLPFLDNKEARVCVECHMLLAQGIVINCNGSLNLVNCE